MNSLDDLVNALIPLDGKLVNICHINSVEDVKQARRFCQCLRWEGTLQAQAGDGMIWAAIQRGRTQGLLSLFRSWKDADTKGFSIADIQHEMRHLGCSWDHALKSLIESERKAQEDA